MTSYEIAVTWRHGSKEKVGGFATLEEAEKKLLEYCMVYGSACVGWEIREIRETQRETADEYARRKPETLIGGAWSRRSRGN